MSELQRAATNTTEWIKSKIGHRPRAQVAIVCGSGLQGLADTFDDSITISYSDIPNFAESTVTGHSSKLVYGTVGAKRVPALAMVGRFHFYEGHSIQTTTFPMRVFKMLEIGTIILTNAAGGLNPDYRVGDIVVLSDHINLPGLTGTNPLVGPNDDFFGTRFPAMSDAYDLQLRRAFFKASRDQAITERRKIHEGVYAFVSGPFYETRAECRLLKSLGADLVGMSTVPEVVVARHCGMRVLAISLCTNESVMDKGPSGAALEEPTKSLSEGAANHEEVLQAGKDAAVDMQNLVAAVIESL